MPAGRGLIKRATPAPAPLVVGAASHCLIDVAKGLCLSSPTRFCQWPAQLRLEMHACNAYVGACG